MKIKKRYRILLIILAAIVLLTAAAVVYLHGEWWYPVVSAMRITPELKLEIADGATEDWTLDELLADGRVTLSNNLLLVNASHPLPKGYEATLVEYNGAKMHPLMLDPYISLRDDVQAKTDVRIYVASDYRTPEEQAAILTQEGNTTAAQVGCSEHEAGLALDVYAPYCGGINFLRSPAGRMVNEICGEYGFILRYPKGKEDLTGIDYEPWHIRYVGQPHAKLIMEHGLTLEEYLDTLEVGTWYVCGEYRFARLSPDAIKVPEGFTQCDISPDNMGYYVVTVRFG
ncbi:MAG: M15 family metallopeptidase [Clostridia bacterium]|nr:M15 family metallopeptidase [Clostridia bacterium]